jgi:hypothetical protein
MNKKIKLLASKNKNALYDLCLPIVNSDIISTAAIRHRLSWTGSFCLTIEVSHFI